MEALCSAETRCTRARRLGGRRLLHGVQIASDIVENADLFDRAKAGAVAAAVRCSPFRSSLARIKTQTLSRSGIRRGRVVGLVFVVTYRYTLRDDLGNEQLKSVVGAFI